MRKMMIMAICLGLLSFAVAQDESRINWDPAYSGNYTVGRGGNSVQYVIVHVVQGSYSGCISWFKNPSAKVSAHYVVSKGGSITQMVHESDTAWHAGNWSYNQRSIGIEHEGYVSDPSFPDAMYRSSADLVKAICNRHGIPKDRQHVIGHVEVPGATHTDPGPNWDWDTFMGYVRDRDSSFGTAPVVEADKTFSPEYRVRLAGIQCNVERIQKSWLAQLGATYRDSLTIGNLFENTTSVPLPDLAQYVTCDFHGEFPAQWSERASLAFSGEGMTDLLYVYDRYDCEIWSRMLNGEWQKIGNLSAYAFKGYRLDNRK
jgi:N-acetyl-anhydromuramyl-L-alanine amidase AmpD